MGVNLHGQTATPLPRSNPPPSPTPTPTATPGEPQDTVKVTTEEVRLPIFAYDDYGHFDPTLEMNEILGGLPKKSSLAKSAQRTSESSPALQC
ncbi:MAG TPA: hypothetical protein VHQ64_16090, partial [Pyrinomonadaceae bacterium]|nr:hypothetical protein [Pyrinomonadaceae bacterium]